jgi:hypothetical protein
MMGTSRLAVILRSKLQLGFRFSCLLFLARFWAMKLQSLAHLSALLSLALMHRAFWPGPALTSTSVRKRAAQQVSIWLSALRQPAHHRAAPKCHTPSPPGFLSSGSRRITTARADFFMRISRPAMIPREEVRAAGSQLWPGQAQFHPVTQRDFWRAQVKC